MYQIFDRLTPVPVLIEADCRQKKLSELVNMIIFWIRVIKMPNL